MASDGPRYPTSVVNDTSFGTIAWTNPGNALASDNSRATTFGYNTSTNYLLATDFDLAIPAGATIDGIVVEVEKMYSQQIPTDSRARIVKGGAIGATNGTNGTAWGAVDAWYSYGANNDLWGETWTADDINGTGFGFAFSARCSAGGNSLPQVDAIRITVYYTEAAAGQPTGKRFGGVPFAGRNSPGVYSW